MRLAIIALVGMGIAANCWAGGPRWIRIQSPNFEIYSTAGERSTRDTLKAFEQVRSFFLENMSLKDAKPVPVRIVQFSGDKEYRPYAFNAVASAYYRPGAERDTIVMSHGGAENFPTAIHEYVHLIVRHAGLKFPPWLGEGLGEFYSTLQQEGNRITIGRVITARLYEMQGARWVPLSVILSADQSSPYYNEKNKAGSFYDESWALVHMLSLQADYRAQWPKLMLAIANGKESVDALTSVYGKSLGMIDLDLQDYVRSNRFAALVSASKLEKIDEKYPAEAAPDFDLKLLLLELEAGKSDAEKEKSLEELAAQEPSRPEPWVQMAYLAWGAGKPATPEVRERFAKAYSLGGRSPRMLWDYGRIITGAQPADAVQVLGELEALEPERRDVKIALATALLNANQPDAAVKKILSLGGCTMDEAVECVSVASVAYLRLNQRDQAQHAAELYLKVAKTPEDKNRAQQMLDFLKRPAPNRRAPAAVEKPDDSDAPPRLEHRPGLGER